MGQGTLVWTARPSAKPGRWTRVGELVFSCVSASLAYSGLTYMYAGGGPNTSPFGEVTFRLLLVDFGEELQSLWAGAECGQKVC